jgi:rRNA maturation RNase YbeY|tara:strand:+ start:585 stop:1073 length:489 start_codon:yes stop_codon:yes gene_type:complete
VVTFHFEDVSFRLRGRRNVRTWLEDAVARESDLSALSASGVATGTFELGSLGFVFCSDERLLEVNRQFLDHDYYTDIITFDDCSAGVLAGEMMVSVDRVRENARTLGLRFEDEMHRVMAHGTLHLVGFKDGTEAERMEMQAAEDRWLALRPDVLNVPRGTNA